MALGTVVIGGGSGFIGRAITRTLKQIGYDVLIISRQPNLHSTSWNDIVHEGLPKGCVAVLNVAGQNVLDPARRWTPGFRQNVYASRVNTTKLLASEIKKMSDPPKVFGVISGVGYYKASATIDYTEDSPGGDHDFFAQLCTEWEGASILPEGHPTRRFVVRSGVVLGRSGGIISQVYWPFYFGLGGRMASGKQYFPWIHIEDIAGIFAHGVQFNSVSGILNGVSPQTITNEEFTKALSRAMWRPSLIPLPEFALKLAFGDVRAAMMTEGQKVIPKRTLESGYKFRFPNIKEACEDCAHAWINYDYD